MSRPPHHLPPEIAAHYAGSGERERRDSAIGQLELARSQEVIERVVMAAVISRFASVLGVSAHILAVGRA